jgi:hypothetical protein
VQRFVTGFLTSNMLNRIVVGDIAIADSELKGVLSDLRFRLLRMEVVSRTPKMLIPNRPCNGAKPLAATRDLGISVSQAAEVRLARAVADKRAEA